MNFLAQSSELRPMLAVLSRRGRNHSSDAHQQWFVGGQYAPPGHPTSPHRPTPNIAEIDPPLRPDLRLVVGVDGRFRRGYEDVGRGHRRSQEHPLVPLPESTVEQDPPGYRQPEAVGARLVLGGPSDIVVGPRAVERRHRVEETPRLRQSRDPLANVVRRGNLYVVIVRGRDDDRRGGGNGVAYGRRHDALVREEPESEAIGQRDAAEPAALFLPLLRAFALVVLQIGHVVVHVRSDGPLQLDEVAEPPPPRPIPDELVHRRVPIEPQHVG